MTTLTDEIKEFIVKGLACFDTPSQGLVHRCERNSVALAIDCLEQAGKECGGIYENRRPVVLQLAVPQPPVPQPALSPNGGDALIESIRLRQHLTVPPAS
jgi:hypothetical protein